MTLINHQVRWGRLLCAAIVASVVGLFGFAAFLQGIHDPSLLQKTIETIGLPLFEIGAEFGVFWIAIIASILLWTVVLYTALTVLVARKHGQPSA